MHEGQMIGVSARNASLIIIRIWNQTNLQCQLKAICKLGSNTIIDQFQCNKKKNNNGENIMNLNYCLLLQNLYHC